MLRGALLLASLGACECGKLVVTTGNLARPDVYNSVADTLVGGIKATFDKMLHVGSEDVKLSAQFEADDFHDLHSPENLKEVSVAGAYNLDVAPPGWNTHQDRHPFKLGYVVGHKFKNGLTALKLTANTYGASVKAKVDSSGGFGPLLGMESVGYGYGIKTAGTNLLIDNGFEFHGRWGADSIYKFAISGWGVTMDVAQPFSPVMPDLGVSTSHEVSAGRFLASSATVGPAVDGGVYSDAKLTYQDKKLQKGAVWEVSASQPLTKLRGTKLTMKRTWSF